MFTGIVLDVGRIEAREARGGDLRLTIGFTRLDPGRVAVGDSICVQGCCLTATAVSGTSFAADLSRETLALTTLGELAVGAAVNLEPALRAGDALGGHLLSGHVDGVGEIRSLGGDARSLRLEITAPAALARYLAPKGSIAVDGVSLTVFHCEGGGFSSSIIPHTANVTTLGSLRPGDPVNLESDMIARYLERLASPYAN
jgi:riboflavin synthase